MLARTTLFTTTKKVVLKDYPHDTSTSQPESRPALHVQLIKLIAFNMICAFVVIAIIVWLIL